MRDKLIEVLKDFRSPICEGVSLKMHDVEGVADFLISKGVTILPEDAITVTRKEINALNDYAKKVKREAIKKAFDAVEELIEIDKRLEHSRAEMSQNRIGEQKHKYAECLCVTLLMDMQMIEDKYMEDQEW